MMSAGLVRRAALWCALAAAAACSPATMGMNRMASALSATADAYARDDDPEFVRLGAPATLKMVEMLLETQPSHPGLLMTACSGFTQYAYAFLQLDSEMIAAARPADAAELRARAARMYSRGRKYCFDALDLRHEGLSKVLLQDPRSAQEGLARAVSRDVPALYWSGAAWAGELSLADWPIARLGELAVASALLRRAEALDEAWGRGAIQEAMIALEGLPRLMGGSPERARQHFEKAVSLSGGQSAFAYVTMASSVSLPARNRAEFERLLKQALAIDVSRTPSLRLANLIAQKRARFLLASAERLFGAR